MDVSDKNDLLIEAIGYDDFYAVQKLLSVGASPNAINVETKEPALVMASSGRSIGIVKLLLEKGADINARTTYGETALHSASEIGVLEVAKLLLEKGADVNAKAIISNIEWTTLAIAKKQGHTDIVQLLEKAGAKE